MRRHLVTVEIVVVDGFVRERVVGLKNLVLKLVGLK